MKGKDKRRSVRAMGYRLALAPFGIKKGAYLFV